MIEVKSCRQVIRNGRSQIRNVVSNVIVVKLDRLSEMLEVK